jgi:hypothetical protein
MFIFQKFSPFFLLILGNYIFVGLVGHEHTSHV